MFNNPGIQIFDGKVVSYDDNWHTVRFHKATFTDDSGEEFIYYLLKTGKEEAFLVSERIRESILKKFENHEKNGCRHITASFEIATFPDDGDSVDQLINRADDAMYRVKTRGRNRIELAEVK